MKNIYSFLTLIIMLTIGTMESMAQSTSGRIHVGYAQYTDQIWEYDGLSPDHDAKVRCAIVLTHDMIAPYIGSTIIGMRVGWDTSTQTGSYDGFVRQTFNGEDLTSGKATVKHR